MSIRHFITTTDDFLPEASRRGFLKSAGTLTGGLVVGFWSPLEDVLAAPRQSYDASAYITIGSDDKVTLTMSRVEMGQGTYTSLPILIAEELEVDLDKVVLVHAPPDVKLYGAPYGLQFTGGSLTIRTLWAPLRQTGAAARTVLIQAAADGWKVAPDSCFAESGQVVHKPTGRLVKYGALVARASKIPMPKEVALKQPSDYKLIGKYKPRLDAKGKVDGSAMYGMDVILPDLKYASVAASPVFGGKLKSVDEAKARALPGVRDVIKLENAVAVIADNTWYARQGMAALDIVWDEGANAKLTTADIQSLMSAGLNAAGSPNRNLGDAQKVIASDPKRVQVDYLNQMLAHAPMEPMNCTVHAKAGSADIWVGTQVPGRAQSVTAKVLGIPEANVTVHNHLIGGGFGRRLYADYVEQAAAIGKQVKGPVKVIWPREEDIQHSMHRGIYAHRVSASLDSKGFPVALMHQISGPSNLSAFIPGSVQNGKDSDAVEGSDNYPYDIANMRTDYIQVDGPVPSGFWRGVGPVRNILVLESFMDQLAHRAGKDPLDFRLAMLSKDKRAHHVLKRAGELAGWGKPVPAGAGRGIALMFAWGTYMAQVVDLTVSAGGDVAVQRVTCVVDCGTVVHQDGVIAQMQGGINYGLSAALYGEITIKDGRVEQSNFHDYPALRFAEAPQIVVEVVQNFEAPGGIGESATAGIGPAFVNAVFAATGKAITALPAKSDFLKKAA